MNSVELPAGVVKRYILIETLTAIVIASLFSIVFAWLFFGSRLDLTLQTPELVRDTGIQGFFVPFWIVLPVTFIGRRRVRAGHAPRSGPWGRWPRNAFVRALLFGILVGIILWALHLSVAASPPSGVLSTQAMLTLKGVIGAVIAILVAPLAARASLVHETVDSHIEPRLT